MSRRKYPGLTVAREKSIALPRFLNIKEAAELLKTSPGAVRNLVWRRKLVTYKPGRKVLIREEDLLRFLESTRK
jgi:excisionase family DNA binding protein